MTDPERLDWMDRNRLILFMALRKVALGKPIREVIDELEEQAVVKLRPRKK
jgi:hypothetical protein